MTIKQFADAQHPRGYDTPQPVKVGPQWFVTFPNGSEHANQYALLQTHDYGAARVEAFERFGRAWAFMYPITDLETQITQYGIKERTE
jgi:hypothetical protein